MRNPSVFKKWPVSLLLLLFLVGVDCGGSGSSIGSGSSGESSETFESCIADYKETYGKTDAWETWMLANMDRYETTFASSSSRPDVITISFRYESAPINYSPAWADESEHMDVLTTMAEGAYPGYTFDIVYESNTLTSYANIIAGITVNASYAYGKDVYLYYETIFNHEFGHIMELPHHYDTVEQIGDGLHMPPGDTQCIMDRNSTMFCSACRTALGIPLDVTDTTDMDVAMNDILSRYPY